MTGYSPLYDPAYFDGALAAWHQLSLPTFAAFLSKMIGTAQPHRVLDLGCGVGTYGQILRQYGASVIGCEYAPEAVTRAQATGWYEKVVPLDLEAASAAQLDGPYALVFCSEVIEHLVDTPRFCQLLADVLEPGGILVLTTTTYHFYLFYYLLCAVPRQPGAYRDFFRGCWDEEAADRFIRSLWFLTGGHYHGFRSRRLQNHLRRVGLRIERCLYANVQPVFPVTALDEPFFRTGAIRWFTPLLRVIGQAVNESCRWTNCYGANVMVAARKEHS